MAKIEFSSRANNDPAGNLLTPIILLLGIVFAVFGIKLKWFRHRLTFNSSASNTPISNSENTNQLFGVYKRNEIDDRDFKARTPNEPTSTYPPTGNNYGESSSSHYKAVKVNNEIKLIPPAPSYVPPTIHQGNIKTTELRVDFNNSTGEEKKSSKYIQVKKDEYNKNTVRPQLVHVAQTHNNKPKAAAPLLVAPQPVFNEHPPQVQPLIPVGKQEVKIQSPLAVAVSAPQIQKPPPAYVAPPVIEVENSAITAKLNSMPTAYVQLHDFDFIESEHIPPPTIRSVKYQDEYESNDDTELAYNNPITINPSSLNHNMRYNDEIEIVSANDDLFTKMKPTPRTTGINYLEYQSNHNKQNNKTDDNSESKFNDDDDYELAPLEFLSKTTTTNATEINEAATVKNEMTQNHSKTTMSNTSKKDERKIVVDDSDDDDEDDDADDDNMWDLVAKHRKNVGRKVEWDQSANLNGKMKNNQRAMMNSIAATAAPDKPKTLRELHSQNRENNRKNAPSPVKPTSKSDVVMFGELEDEADA